MAVGLLYHYGYFRQRLGREGWQEERYGETDPAELPLHQVTGDDGKPLQIEVSIRQRSVLAQVWRADVGRVQLYLLDTNITANAETDRWVTGHLYGGDRETRIVQEMLLGIGGVRLLRKLAIQPAVFHLNEGHSAFLTLELARELVKSKGLTFADAAKLVREQCVFTTHTPVAAGNDEFDVDLLSRSFGGDYEKELGLNHEEFLALGRNGHVSGTEQGNPRKASAGAFGLTPLAIRMCRSTNGVSRKHGEVSRALWQKLWPEETLEQIPITHVTNGVHAPTWVAPMIGSLYEKHAGSDWPQHVRNKTRWAESISQIPDEELWAAHLLLKGRLIEFIRQRSFLARVSRGETQAYSEAARQLFEPEVLTIGFARRVAGYKRWNLLLKDSERLLRIINNVDRPVQFVFAGKAHPQDQEAKVILQQVARWERNSAIADRFVVLEDYDHEIARQLVQSVDVWLNVPRRPQEASGTSGEKVAMNGGLNLSVLDGWWLEAMTVRTIAVGDEIASANEAEMDRSDAESLIAPGSRWCRLLRPRRRRLAAQVDYADENSIATLVPEFNSDRMVEEYARRIHARRGNREWGIGELERGRGKGNGQSRPGVSKSDSSPKPNFRLVQSNSGYSKSILGYPESNFG